MHGSLADSSSECKKEIVYCWGGKVQRRKPRLNTQESNCEQGLTAAVDLGEARHKPAFDKPLRFWGDLLVMCYCHLTFQQRTCALPVGLERVETGGWYKAPPEQSISKSCGTHPMRSLSVQCPWQFGCQGAMDSELKFSQATTLAS